MAAMGGKQGHQISLALLHQGQSASDPVRFCGTCTSSSKQHPCAKRPAKQQNITCVKWSFTPKVLAGGSAVKA
jgi:hypothetical protein